MKTILMNIFASVFEFLDRRWRRQALWILPGPLIIGLITKSMVTGIILLVSAAIIYLVWITLGTRMLTEKRSKSIISNAASGEAKDLEDVSMLKDFKDTEVLLGIYTKSGFVKQQAGNPTDFHGLSAFFRRFSLNTRFQVALVEINGRKFVRKRYTASDYKFFQALQNYLIIKKLCITPKPRYVSLPERCIWTEFIDGPSLHYLCVNDLITQKERSEFAAKLIEFKNSLHRLGLCNLDLHRGNIILRRTDNRAMLVDIDEAKHYSANSLLFRLHCIKDQKRVGRQVNLLTGSSNKTQ